MDSTLLSNITTSEGLLSRFSDICINLGYEGYSSTKIHDIINKEFKLSNDKVRNRHLNIMQKLNLLHKRHSDGTYIYNLGPYGKLINNFNIKLRRNSHYLYDSEKIVYAYILFTNYNVQFFPILDIIYKKGKILSEELIVNYFESVKNMNIWSSITIEKGLYEWNINRKLIRSFENRFKCMESWLIDINLIEKYDDYINISLLGRNLFNMINNVDNIYFENFIKIYLPKTLKNIDIRKEDDYSLVKKIILKEYKIFKEPTGFADIQVLYKCAMLILAFNYNYILPNYMLNDLLDLLWKDGLVSSLSNDDKGILRYAVFK